MAAVATEPMPNPMCSELLRVLNEAPVSTWVLDEENGHTNVTFEVGGWKVVVFFDGWTVEDWDYIDHVVAPDGAHYRSYVHPPELPVALANWSPRNRLTEARLSELLTVRP